MFLSLFKHINDFLNYRNVMVFYNICMGFAVWVSPSSNIGITVFERIFFDATVLAILFWIAGFLALFGSTEIISIIPSTMYLVALFELGLHYGGWVPAVMMVTIYFLSYHKLLDGE